MAMTNEKKFFEKVYAIVARIPCGKVATYGQIAMMLGSPSSARTVGWAMKATPPDVKIPCHRVVNSKGTLAPVYAFGGTDVQRAMLESEGITFDKGRVNVAKHIWDGREKA